MKLEFSGSSYLIHTNILTEFYENLRWCMWDPWTTCHGMTHMAFKKCYQVLIKNVRSPFYRLMPSQLSHTIAPKLFKFHITRTVYFFKIADILSKLFINAFIFFFKICRILLQSSPVFFFQDICTSKLYF